MRKNIFKKSISLLLVALMLFSAAPLDLTADGILSVTANAAESGLFTYIVEEDSEGSKYAVITAVSSEASGMLVIPAQFEADGNVYEVKELDYHALDNCPNVTGLDFSQFSDPMGIEVNYDSVVEGEEESADRLNNIKTIVLPCIHRISDFGLSLDEFNNEIEELKTADFEVLAAEFSALLGVTPANREEAIGLYLNACYYNSPVDLGDDWSYLGNSFAELDSFFIQNLGMDYFSYITTYALMPTFALFFMLEYGLNSVDTYLTSEEDVIFKSVDGIIYTDTIRGNMVSKNPQSMLVMCPPAKTDINITEPISGVSAGAFAGSATEKLVIPATVTTYSQQAFVMMDKLNEIEFKGVISYDDFSSAFAFGGLVDDGALTRDLTVKTHNYGNIADIESYTEATITFVPYENHTLTVSDAVAATCSTPGKEGSIECDVCGTIGGGKETDTLPHNYGDDRICDDCGYESVAVESGSCGENVTYALYDTGELVISGTGDMYDDDTPFSFNDMITSVTVEDGVTSIGVSAFFYCPSLTSVTIAGSVTSIGESAFGYCTSLTSVTIPKGVTSIGEMAFNNCSSLTSVIIPDSVTNISYGAFLYCPKLMSVTVPSSVTSIEYYAFGYNYDEEYNLILVDGFTLYGYKYSAAETYAKQYGVNFESIGEAEKTVIDSGICGDNVTYELYNTGELVISGTGEMYGYDYGDSPFYNDNRITSVTIEEGVTNIGYMAFLYCTNLTSVTIAKSVKSIESGAFYVCTSLKSVTIPDGVKSIGDSAFCACTSLTSVTIADSVTNISYGAFSSCPNLMSVTVPASVTSIGSMAFGYTSSEGQPILVDGFTISGYANSTAEMYATQNSIDFVSLGEAEKAVIASGNCGENVAYALYNTGELVISGTGDMYDYAYGDSPFYFNDKITSVTVEDGVTSIGDYAFVYCPGLTSVTIAGSVTNIGSYAFYYNSTLSSVTILDGVTSLSNCAFYYCQSLMSVSVPSSVTSIGYYALGYTVSEDGELILLDGFTISGYTNSAAETYANNNGITFVSISPSTPSHNVQHFAANESTCTQEGNIEYWYCSDCNKYYSDANEENEITQAETVIAAGHIDADANSYCDRCNELLCEHNGETYMLGIVDATCHSKGYTGDIYCLGCNNKIANGEETEIDLTNHDGATTVDGDVAATCHSKGYTGDTYCLGCNNKIADGEETEIDLTNHDGETTVRDTVAATCHSKGYTGNTYCLGCNNKIADGEETELDLTNHDGETTVRDTVTATCHSKGYTGNTYCLGCNNKIADGEETEIDLTNHDGETTVRDTVTATCHSKGYTGNTYCLGCNNKIADGEETEIDLTNHDGATTVDGAVAATCHSKGNTGVVYCLGCNNKIADSEETEIDLTNHDGATTVDDVVTATCHSKGYTGNTYCLGCNNKIADGEETEIDLTNHDGATTVDGAVAATCHSKGNTGVVYCLGCNNKIADSEETEIDLTNHDGETTVDDVVTATCHSKGYTGDTYCLGCNNKIADGEETEVDLTNHDGETEIRDIEDGTCHSKGYTGNTYCLGCNNKIADGEETAIDPENHDGDTEIRGAVAATCVAKGYSGDEYYQCCDTVKTNGDETPIDPDNHTAVAVDKAVEPTCYSIGYTEGSHCEDCGNTVVAQDEIPMLAHKYVFVSTATNENGSYMHYECSVCEDSYDDYNALKLEAALELIEEATSIAENTFADADVRDEVTAKLAEFEALINQYVVFDEEGNVVKNNIPYDDAEFMENYAKLYDNLTNAVAKFDGNLDYSISNYLRTLIQVIAVILDFILEIVTFFKANT